MSESTGNLTRVRRDLVAWLADTANEPYFHECRQACQVAVSSEDPDKIGDCIGNLGFMHNFLASNGVRALLEGRDGWPQIHNAWLYDNLEQRIAMYYFELSEQREPSIKRRNEGYKVFHSSCIWAYAVSCERQREAAYFGSLISTFFPSDSFVSPQWRSKRRLEPFLVWLYRKQQNVGVQDLMASADFGPYKGIIEGWDRPAQNLVAPLVDACDYHCRRLFDTGDYEEFYSMPYALVPAEILAVRKIRDRLGLPTPEVKHPLLDTNCARIHGSPGDVADPLVTALEAKLGILAKQLRKPIIPIV